MGTKKLSVGSILAIQFIATLAYFLYNRMHPVAKPNAVCYAYLDPSTSSMIISAIAGVLATIVLGVKTFWYKITSPFRPRKVAQPQVSPEAHTSSDQPKVSPTANRQETQSSR